MATLWLPAGSKVPLGMRRHWAAYRPGLPDPVGAWELNEGSGSLVNDSSGNGNGGTLVASPIWVPTPRGVGLQFVSASSQSFNAGNTVPFTSDVKSIWMRFSGVTWSNPTGFLGFTKTGLSSYRWVGRSDRKLYYPYLNPGFVSEALPSAGPWSAVIATDHANAPLMWNNGISLSVTTSTTAGTGTNAGYWIGTRTGQYDLNATIETLCHWNDILLTASQVAALEGPVPIWQRQRYYQIGGALQYLTPGSVVAASALGSPSLGLGAVTLTPASNVAASAVGAPTVTPGAVGLTPASVAADSALGTPTVTPGSLGITPSSIVGASTPGTPTITSGSKSLSPASLTASSGVGIPTISEGALALLVNSIIAQTALGMPLITASGSLLTDVAYPLAATFGARQELAATAVVRLDSWSEDGTTLGLLVPLPAWVETDLRFRVRIDDILGAAVDLTKFRLRSLIEDPEDGIAVGEFRLTVENINTLLFEWDATGAEAGRAYVFDLRAKDRGGIRSRPVHGTIVMLPVVT